MTGAEFRALMAAAGLSVRAAARLLGVDPKTIQRWRRWPDERSPTPYWAVHQIQQHIGDKAIARAVRARAKD